VNVGEFEEQDAAVVQAWHERDVEDAEYSAHRLAERQDENAGHAAQVVDVVVYRDDTALDRRIAARERMLQRTMSHLDATSVEDLEAYRTRQNSLIIHYNSLTKLGGVDHLYTTRRRVVRSDNGEIVHLQCAAM
jgi:DNA integrity scanning protein DisA with diadenylate cyclase activity